ncbi:hypothetical protein [Streptomyces chartreusis]|uniref:hypothetical protein n=1 Tax=Streptomyces chartreusis TaxID=1969 RepID=UPI0036C89D10
MDRLGGKPPVQQQNLDQRPGARRVAVRLEGGSPECFMGGGERAIGPGGGQRSRTPYGTGLDQQDFSDGKRGTSADVTSGTPGVSNLKIDLQ